MAGVPIIILNSTEAATALFEDKGLIYSDKPHLHFLMENVGLHDFPFLQPDGPPVRRYRRIIAQSIGTTSSLKRYTSMIEMETRKFLHRLLDKPSSTDIYGHLFK
jgi:cytochrome P450